MDAMLLLKFASAFVFVISLMLLLAWGLRRFGVSGSVMRGPARHRLRVVEFMPLDSRRRLVLVRCDNSEHLLLLGPQSEAVVAADIPAREESVVEFLGDRKNVQS